MIRTANEKATKEYVVYLVEQERAPATVEKYKRDVRAFLQFIGDEKISKELMLRYKTHLCDNFAPRSVNSILASVNGFLVFLGLEKLRVKKLRIQREVFCPRDKELSRSEYERLVCTARRRGKERLALVIETLCSTGIRISELKYITVEAANNSRTTVDCKGKVRTVFLTPELCRKLKKYCLTMGIQSGPIFKTSGGKTIDRSNVWSEMQKLCDAAGVEKNKVFPHNLRHLFARAFYKIEKDISRLADILGHSSVDTTRLYIVSSGWEHERQLASLKLII